MTEARQTNESEGRPQSPSGSPDGRPWTPRAGDNTNPQTTQERPLPSPVNRDEGDLEDREKLKEESRISPSDATLDNDQNSSNTAQLGKRKESHDRATEPASPGALNEHPAKRRGSNVERISYSTVTERNDQPTLTDPSRVNFAIASAAGGPSSQWWANASERRDSTASVYSNRSLNSSAGYGSASTANTSYASLSLAEKLGGPIPPQPPITAFPMTYNWPPVPAVQISGAPAPSGNNPNGGGAGGAGAGGAGGNMGAPPSRGPLPPNENDRIVIDPALSSVRSGAQSPGSHTPTLVYDAQPPLANSESPMDEDHQGSGSVTRGAKKAQSAAGSAGPTFLSPPDDGTPSKDAPFSRSPELRVSHKLAERKRRKEMKDLFDELREQLPADRGMKASKWEILSKAVDFISNMKAQHTELVRENDGLRREVDMARAAGVAQAQAQAQAQAYPPPPHFQHHGYIPQQYPPAGPYVAPPGQAQQPPPPQGQQPPASR